jgi:hypothetical protein
MSNSLLVVFALVMARHPLPSSTDAVAMGRAQFSERAKGLVDEYIYDSGEVVPTIVLFPVGVADRRYLIGQTPPAPEGAWYLTCQHSKRGMARTQWRTKLVPWKGSAVSGTLAKFMADRGVMLPANSSMAAATVVSAEKPFAAYMSHGFSNVVMYWYVAVDGVEAELKGWDLSTTSRFASTGVMEWPTTGVPYPLTELEKRSMSQQARKAELVGLEAFHSPRTGSQPLTSGPGSRG